MFDVDLVREFKKALGKEKIAVLNLDYISNEIENWWSSFNQDKYNLRLAKFPLANLIISKIRPEHAIYLNTVGLNNVAGVTINNLFKTDSEKLAYVVHETMSELFGLSDIKYPYEEHKKIYLKADGINYQDWGNGFGKISPHSDDLYEELDTELLSLTVCRDKTNTSTSLYLYKDIFSEFSDLEISQLFNITAKFISGKNVSAYKYRERKVIEYQKKIGFNIFFDFRVDTEIGCRMLPTCSIGLQLLKKAKETIHNCHNQETLSQTGTFTIISNLKALHAREEMHINKKIALEIANINNYAISPRLLFRSKGQSTILRSQNPNKKSYGDKETYKEVELL